MAAYSHKPKAAAGGVTLGFLSLGLAATGLFALMSYTVRRRTREIEVRLAVGASPRAIARMVLRDGVALVAGGVVGGLAVAIPIGIVMKSALFGVSPLGPAVVAAVVLVFVVVAMAASALPAGTSWARGSGGRLASRVGVAAAVRTGPKAEVLWQIWIAGKHIG